MSYKEYILVFLTIICGLAITNLYQGLGHIYRHYTDQALKIYRSHYLLILLIFMSIIDLIFFGFNTDFNAAKTNVWQLFLFLIPPSCLYFSSLILFPEKAQEMDYKAHLRNYLRPILYVQLLFMLIITISGYFALQNQNLFKSQYHEVSIEIIMLSQAFFIAFTVAVIIIQDMKWLFWLSLLAILGELAKWTILSMNIYSVEFINLGK